MPAIAVMPGKIKPGCRNHDILGGLDLMATFAAPGEWTCRRRTAKASR